MTVTPHMAPLTRQQVIDAKAAALAAPAPLALGYDADQPSLRGNNHMNFLALFHLLTEVLAAAPGVEATVEQAVAAFHASTNDTGKVYAVMDAASHLTDMAAKVAATPAKEA